MSAAARKALEQAAQPSGAPYQQVSALVGIGYAIVELAEAATRIANAFEAAREGKR